jgi:hypothetical protein
MARARYAADFFNKIQKKADVPIGTTLARVGII